MDLPDLIGDPLYQVNLTLWMLQPQPSAAITVEPILRNAGLSLRGIETVLPLPPGLLAKLSGDGIAAQTEAAPDLLLNGPERLVVLWECKRSTFGKPQGGGEPSHRQARCFLLQTPNVLTGALAAAPASIAAAHLIYFSRFNPAHDQAEGLKHLRDELAAKDNLTIPFCVLALSASAAGVEIRQAGTSSTAAPGMPALTSPKTVQTCADEQTDPRPLYYIPWMPGTEPQKDSYNHYAFGCRVLNAAAEVIGLTRPPSTATIDFEDALQRATNGHYRLWRNKNSRQAVREAARQLIRAVVAGAASDVKLSAVGQPAAGWRVELPHDKLKGKIIKALRQWPGHDWLTPHIQLELSLPSDPASPPTES